MNKIDTLIAYLFAIQAFAKDIHYLASGEAFYSKHLLADEIYKGIDEQIDALIETCILPYGLPRQIGEYWSDAKGIIPSTCDFKSLKLLLTDALDYIDEELSSGERGAQAIIDNIAQELQRKLGLITRQVE